MGQESESESCSVISDSVTPQTVACWALCSWNSPGKDTGVGCHSLLQGIFPTQGSNPGLQHYRWILYHLSHQGNPVGQETNAQLSCSLQGRLCSEQGQLDFWVLGGGCCGFGIQGYWLGRGWGVGASLTKGRCSGFVHFDGHISRACFTSQGTVPFFFFFTLLIRE